MFKLTSEEMKKVIKIVCYDRQGNEIDPAAVTIPEGHPVYNVLERSGDEKSN